MVKKFKTFGPQLVFAEQSAGSVVALTNEQKLSIYKKSQKSGISTDILEEVYRRGYSIWNESFGQTAEQFAFDRVNSFIAGGFAADLDEDLMEKRGLWDNIHAKRERIKHGSGERMRKPGSKGAPTDEAIRASQNEAADPCWDNYKQVGMKMKGGKKVPNCVPVEEDIDPVTDRRFADFLKDYEEKKRAVPTSVSSAAQRVQDKPIGKDQMKFTPKTSTPQTSKAPVKEAFETAEKQSKNPNDPSSRFDGTTSAVNVYKKATPYAKIRKTTNSIIKETIRETLEINEALSPRQKASSARFKKRDVRVDNPKSNFDMDTHKVDVTVSKDGKKEKIRDTFKAKDKHQAVFNAQMKYHKAGYKVHDTKHAGIVNEETIDEMMMGNPNKLSSGARQEWREKHRLAFAKKKAAGKPEPTKEELRQMAAAAFKNTASMQKEEAIDEATYKGKTVPLNKPMKGDVKKSKVYVDPDGDGKAKKVNFGDKHLSIKKNIPARKKSYCARSAGQGNLTKKDSANYWSRRAWNCEETINELSVPAGTTGKRTDVASKSVAIRMASGKIEKHPPGKSGSSGGGDEE